MQAPDVADLAILDLQDPRLVRILADGHQLLALRQVVAQVERKVPPALDPLPVVEHLAAQHHNLARFDTVSVSTVSVSTGIVGAILKVYRLGKEGSGQGLL